MLPTENPARPFGSFLSLPLMLWVVLPLALLLATGCPIPQSQDTPVDHTLESDPIYGEDYYLYVPSDYDKKKAYPLVMSLHGTIPFDMAWHQIREWKALGEEKKFIVAIPKLDSTQGILPKVSGPWLKSLLRDEKTILAVRRDVCRRYNVDKSKILLTGFSAGGYPMYWTGLRNPTLFNALVARACNSDDRIFERIELTPKTRRIPVIIYVGKDDHALKDPSWLAFGWLRKHGWTPKNSDMKKKRGGHIRRPDLAYQYWQKYMGNMN